MNGLRSSGGLNARALRLQAAKAFFHAYDYLTGFRLVKIDQ